MIMSTPRTTQRRVSITEDLLYADVTIHIGARTVAETTLAKGVTLQSESVQRFVNAYDHRPFNGESK